VTGFGLAAAVEGGVVCACADGPETAKPAAAIINVAESTDLMTNPREYWSGMVERSLTSEQLSTSA
jgi:hypothetical protein